MDYSPGMIDFNCFALAVIQCAISPLMLLRRTEAGALLLRNTRAFLLPQTTQDVSITSKAMALLLGMLMSARQNSAVFESYAF